MRLIRNPFLMAALAVLLAIAVFGCARKPVSSPMADGPTGAWSLFRQQYCVPSEQPGMLVKASLYYSRTKPTRRTNRTLMAMWGDFGGPMRLDISAGIGKLLAHISENGDGLLVFYPTDKVAYSHANPVLGAARLGMPFPFSLEELGRVSMGDFSGLVPTTFAKATIDDANFTYLLQDGLAASVTLAPTGRPIIIEGFTTSSYGEKRAWQLKLDKYDDSAIPIPNMLTLSVNGEKGVLRIKSRELKGSPWPDEAMKLELPEDIMYRRLDRMGRSDDQS